MNLNLLFKTILQISAMGSIVALIIIIAKVLFKNKLSATWHYYIWFLLMIRLVLPYSTPTSFSVFNLFQFASQQVETSGYIKEVKPLITSENNLDPNSPILEEEFSFGKSYRENTAEKNSLKGANISLRIKDFLPILWVLGIGILSLYILGTYIIFLMRFSKDPLCEDEEIIDILKDCTKSMGINKKISVIYSNKIKTPTLCGIIKPKILVPRKAMDSLSLKEKRYVFLHELSHLKRKDILFNWISTVLLVIHWFNPILWLSFSRMKKDCEVCCDELTLKYINPEEYKNYGETLIKLMSMLSLSNWTPGTTSMANKNEIKRRIIMISKFKKKPVLTSVLAVLITVAVGFTVLTNGKDKAPSAATNNITESSIEPSKDNTQEEATTDTTTTKTEEVKNTNAETEPVKDTIKKEETSNNNKSKEVSSEVSKNNTANISDQEIIKILSEGYVNLRKYEILFNTDATIEKDNQSYAKLGKDLKNYNEAIKYLDSEISFSKYYSKNFKNNFLNYMSKEIDGELYFLLGNFGIGFKMNEAEITSKKVENNSIIMTLKLQNAAEDYYGDFKATLVLENGKWLIDKINVFGIATVE
ncbi:M56 family metallopeptidase [Clostridium amazonitimonense]|uniref:M56 family metallopeptidase n=1 Tax=Clostridium amazonitimonense TaxID=1499689 RepID=UPI0005096064|nr:M56 family metallopeptidase [Clostridium amazonitimonense]